MSEFDQLVLKFPSQFLWGTATAAFQIEGHPEESLAKLSDWACWLDSGKVSEPTGQGRAVEHYQHLLEDVALIRGLNNNAYRFSFNWARLHRGPGEFDFNTVKFYQSLLNELKAKPNRVEPFATIVHFVLPQWLAKEGGWTNPATAREFGTFTKFLVEQFGSDIKFWITHNEPNILLNFGYESGIWPPGYTNDWKQYLEAYQGMLLGHQLAYKAIKNHNPNAQVGLAQNFYCFEAQEEIDRVPNIIRNQLHNFSFVEACLELGALDFLGVNYYTRFSYRLNPRAKDPHNNTSDSTIWGELNKPSGRVNSLGWELYPEGLYKVLTDTKLQRILNGLPVYITENGYCNVENESQDIDDDYRIKFIQEHLVAVHRAIQAGIDVRGYFYWSLLDNFEWALGMKPRFGLVHVNHESYIRQPKKSYDYYAQVAKFNGLPPHLFKTP